MAVSLLDRRLLIVTGKGGVGKTSIAGALAVLGAQQGKRTLVCEVDAKGALATHFEVDALAYAPREVQPGLFAMTMDTEESLEEYLRIQLRLPLFARIGPLARTFDFVATAAPGVREVLTIGKLCWEVRERRYDLVIADASASGHVVSQLTAPDAIGDLVRVGRVKEQTRWMSDLLGDPAITGVVLVTTPEELPVNETIELATKLREQTAADLAAVVVNRVLPELFSRTEEEVFERLRTGDALVRLRERVGVAVDDVLEAAEYAVRLRRSRAVHLTALRQRLPGEAFVYVPERFTRPDGLRTTRHTAEMLAQELL